MPPDAPVDVELLIEARWVLPMSEELPVLVDHAVAIRAGRLLGPWPIATPRQRVNAQRVLRLDRHALMPGLVNAHNHAGSLDLPIQIHVHETTDEVEQSLHEHGELCDIDTQQLKHMAAARQRAMAHTRQQGEAQ